LPEVTGCGPGQGSLSSTGATRPAGLPAELLDCGGCDAANRSGVSVESVRVVSATAEHWPDASLDCPRPGAAYADVNTDGYRLVLTADGTTFDYRIGVPPAGAPFIHLCLR